MVRHPVLGFGSSECICNEMVGLCVESCCEMTVPPTHCEVSCRTLTLLAEFGRIGEFVNSLQLLSTDLRSWTSPSDASDFHRTKLEPLVRIPLVSGDTPPTVADEVRRATQAKWVKMWTTKPSHVAGLVRVVLSKPALILCILCTNCLGICLVM